MPKRQGDYIYIKRCLSLREDIDAYAKEKSSEYGGNLSAYISWLIAQDMKGIRLSEISVDTRETKPPISEIDLNKPIPNKARAAIDAVMDFDNL